MNAVLDRDALYYPSIHIRDPLWLKQTLLCFPQVRRMVPLHYRVRDIKEVREFRDLLGPRGEPLLYEEDIYGYEVYQAQARLANKMQNQPEESLRRFTRSATQARYGYARDSFQIHRGKLMDVLDFLEHRDLAWSPRDRERGGWVAVHPDLGRAVMSFIAIGLAEAKGLDIVTDSEEAHLAVATRNEELVFEELLYGHFGRSPARREPSDNVDDLVQVVMSSCFDVSKLTPRQIADLLSDGKDLRSFKQALVPIAESIPEISNPIEREKRFKEAAGEVIDKWLAYKKSLPRFALDALVETTKISPPEWVASLSAGLTGHYAVGAKAGILIGFTVHAGLGIVREFKERANSPFRYLSRLNQAGAVLTVSR